MRLNWYRIAVSRERPEGSALRTIICTCFPEYGNIDLLVSKVRHYVVGHYGPDHREHISLIARTNSYDVPAECLSWPNISKIINGVGYNKRRMKLKMRPRHAATSSS